MGIGRKPRSTKPSRWALQTLLWILPIDKYTGQYSLLPVATKTVVLLLPIIIGTIIESCMFGSFAMMSYKCAWLVWINKSELIYLQPFSSTSYQRTSHEINAGHWSHILGKMNSQTLCWSYDSQWYSGWVCRGHRTSHHHLCCFPCNGSFIWGWVFWKIITYSKVFPSDITIRGGVNCFIHVRGVCERQLSKGTDASKILNNILRLFVDICQWVKRRSATSNWLLYGDQLPGRWRFLSGSGGGWWWGAIG